MDADWGSSPLLFRTPNGRPYVAASGTFNSILPYCGEVTHPERNIVRPGTLTSTSYNVIAPVLNSAAPDCAAW